MNKLMMFAALAVSCASPLTVSAQAWPARSISLIVPGVPGTGGDVIARELAQKLAGPLGHPSVTLEATYYVMAPAGTPRPIIERLSKEIYAVMSSKDTIERLGQQAMAPTKALAPDAHKFIMDELRQWEKMIADTAPQKS